MFFLAILLLLCLIFTIIFFVHKLYEESDISEEPYEKLSATRKKKNEKTVVGRKVEFDEETTIVNEQAFEEYENKIDLDMRDIKIKKFAMNFPDKFAEFLREEYLQDDPEFMLIKSKKRK